ncbi:hypothetical protein PsorP6_004871 [Peronosclerospora sorghi]|uniref:Uncharacterized protein n=1 Tax=Peronosclerospora sorghi TaxID=230839 RepID=A0ACC0W5Y7_9STRA|nr:hypothetical protein PsorP6_004871 [Peronosclerospora sorghi]
MGWLDQNVCSCNHESDMDGSAEEGARLNRLKHKWEPILGRGEKYCRTSSATALAIGAYSDAQASRDYEKNEQLIAAIETEELLGTIPHLERRKAAGADDLDTGTPEEMAASLVEVCNVLLTEGFLHPHFLNRL